MYHVASERERETAKNKTVTTMSGMNTNSEENEIERTIFYKHYTQCTIFIYI